MILLTLPYLIVSNVLIWNSNLFVLAGPRLIRYDLLNGTETSYNYLKLCGSFQCIPFCIGVLGNSIVIGTSGSLLMLDKGKLSPILNKPVTSCSDVISVSIVYRDPNHVVTYGEVLDSHLKPVYEGCAVYTATEGFYSLICNDTYYLRTPCGTTEIDSPALVSRGGKYVGVLTLTGRFSVFRGCREVHELELPSAFPPYFLNGSANGFLIVAGGKLYLWRNNGLYSSNLTDVVEAVWYGRSLVVVKRSNSKLVIELVKNLQWTEVEEGERYNP